MGSKPLKAGAEDGMRVNKGHKDAAEFSEVDIKPKLLPRLHEQLGNPASFGSAFKSAMYDSITPQ
jgi:hypothetical protein